MNELKEILKKIYGIGNNFGGTVANACILTGVMFVLIGIMAIEPYNTKYLIISGLFFAIALIIKKGDNEATKLLIDLFILIVSSLSLLVSLNYLFASINKSGLLNTIWCIVLALIFFASSLYFVVKSKIILKKIKNYWIKHKEKIKKNKKYLVGLGVTVLTIIGNIVGKGKLGEVVNNIAMPIMEQLAELI